MKKAILTIVIFTLSFSLFSINIGLSYREETDIALWEALMECEYDFTPLSMITTSTLSYNEEGKIEGKDKNNALTKEQAKIVRETELIETNASLILEGIDLIIISGGRDISPSLYGEEDLTDTKKCAEEDVSDYFLIKSAIENNIPLIGICRGMQAIAVYYNCQLLQELDSPLHYSKTEDYTSHSIYITNKDSLLYSLFNESIVSGLPSRHHQAVKSIKGTKLEVTAYTESENRLVIEAIESLDSSFIFGIQFHPEKAVANEKEDSMKREEAILFFSSLISSAVSTK